jgi:hypothetical protein
MISLSCFVIPNLFQDNTLSSPVVLKQVQDDDSGDWITEWTA